MHFVAREKWLGIVTRYDLGEQERGEGAEKNSIRSLLAEADGKIRDQLHRQPTQLILVVDAALNPVAHDGVAVAVPQHRIGRAEIPDKLRREVSGFAVLRHSVIIVANILPELGVHRFSPVFYLSG